MADQEMSALADEEIALLRKLEEDLFKPEVRRSAERVNDLLADDFIEFGSSGRIFDKRQIIDALQQEALGTVHRTTIADFTVRRLAATVLLLTYRATSPDHTGSRLRSSIWKLINGRWQMIFHQGTPSRG
jgi:hypothetical protein